jgi:hypothetical protein
MYPTSITTPVDPGQAAITLGAARDRYNYRVQSRENVTESDSSNHEKMLPLLAGGHRIQNLADLMFEFDHIELGMNRA